MKRAAQLVHQYTGIHMVSSKQRLLEGRLRKRMKCLNISSYGEYLCYLENQKQEIEHFINAVTTNESSFFRTTRVWEHFRKTTLVSWSEQNPNKAIHIWSGAASSGEEVYTVAICCAEFAAANPGFRYQIDATDISTEIIAKAQEGVYDERRILRFRAAEPQLFLRYLRKEGEHYSIVPELRKDVQFGIHNLFSPCRRSNHYDIVFLRNVLIYFDNSGQEQVLRNVANSMKSDGTLFVGESESLSSLTTPFDFEFPQIYKKASKRSGAV